MAQEISSCQAGGGANGGSVSFARLQELQVVDVVDGKTIEIPLQGHPTLHSSSQAAAPEAAGGENTTVAESKDSAEADKYLNNMRGWIMTVATLFVSMSFQTMSQRPGWMPDPKDGLNIILSQLQLINSTTTLAQLLRSKSTDATEKEAKRAMWYALFNTLTFSTSLVVVVILLLPNVSSLRTLRTVRTMMMFLAFIFAVNFAFMISKDSFTMRIVFSIMVLLVSSTLLALYTFSSSSFCRFASKLTRRGSRLRPAYGV